MINFFTNYFTYFLSICFLLGLVLGSFLNVVIYRLPLMLQAGWRRECCELLEVENKCTIETNLIQPRSHCPHCQQSLRTWHNIPLLSFLLLKGKCAFCKHSITWHYPLIELITALFTVFIAVRFGFSYQMLAAWLFTWCLLALTFIDFNQQLLPDNITLPLLWLGLLINIFGLFNDLTSAVIGACAGYLSLWSIAKIYELITNKMGMGHGDFKLLALIGAWLGWQLLPLIILLASFIGSIIGISLVIIKKYGRQVPIPFGPYLAGAGWLGLVFNHELLNIYSWLSNIISFHY